MRLAVAIGCDLRLQWRNGFYYATALVVLVSILLLRWLPEDVVAVLLPIVIFENVATNSFFFVAGLLFLENIEGTRAAQVVTPLRTRELILSKALTLGALSLIESLLIVAAVQGVGLETLPLAIGVALASALLTLLGIAIASRYDSITDYLMPAVLYSGLLSLPLLGWLGIGSAWWYAWHPLDAPFRLMGSAYAPMNGTSAALAIAWTLLWFAPAYLWCRGAIRRSVRA